MTNYLSSLVGFFGRLQNFLVRSIASFWFWFKNLLIYIWYVIIGYTNINWDTDFGCIDTEDEIKKKNTCQKNNINIIGNVNNIYPNILKDINDIVDNLKNLKSVLVNGSCKMGKGDISIYLPAFIHNKIIHGKTVKCVYLKVFTQKANRPEDDRLVETYENYPGAVCLPTISTMVGDFGKELANILRKQKGDLHVIIVDEADYGNAVHNNISNVYDVIRAEGIECLFVLPSASNFENNELCTKHFIRMSMTRAHNYIGNDSHLAAGRITPINQGAFITKKGKIRLSDSLKRLVDQSPSDTINIVRISQDGSRGFSRRLEASNKRLKQGGIYVMFAHNGNTNPEKTFRFDGKTLASCLENYEDKDEFFARLAAGEPVHFILVLNKVAGRQTKFEFNHLVSLYYHYYSPSRKPALSTFAQEIGRLSGYYQPHTLLRLAIPDARALEAELAFNKDGDIDRYRKLIDDMKMRGAERHSLEDCRKKIRIKTGQIGNRYAFTIVQGTRTGEQLFDLAASLGYQARTATKKNRAAISTIQGDQDAVRALLFNRVRKLGGSKGAKFDAAWVEFNGTFHINNKPNDINSILSKYPVLRHASMTSPCYILMAESLSPEVPPTILVKKADALENTNALEFYTQNGVGLNLAQ